MTFSMSNADFYGTTGPLVYVTLQADDAAEPVNKTATIVQQVFTESSGEQNKWDDVSFTITVSSALLVGDVTGNGVVDGDDVAALIGIIKKM